MEISFTYYTRAKPHDWFAVMAHARINDSEDAGDNWTHIELITLRIRIGSYRVIYEIRDDRLVVLVVSIGHRKEIYR